MREGSGHGNRLWPTLVVLWALFHSPLSRAGGLLSDSPDLEEVGSDLAEDPSERAQQPKRRVLVVPMHVEGEVRAHAVEALDAKLREALSHEDIVLLDGPSPCSTSSEPDACSSDGAEDIQADYIVEVRLSALEREYHLELKARRVGEAAVETLSESSCPVCGTAEVAEVLASRARGIRDWLLADSTRAHIELTGTPPGATVRIDGEQVGELPYTGELPPGEHRVVVEAPGHLGVERSLQTSAGASVAIELRLDPAPTAEASPLDAPSPEPQPRWRLTLAGTSLALGLGGLVSGVTFLALDGRPIESRCADLTALDTDGDCKYIYTSKPAGLGLLVGGAVAALVGVSLGVVELRERRRASTRARIEVEASVDRVGLRWSF